MLNISAMKTGRKEINRREKKKSHDKFADMDKSKNQRKKKSE